MAGLVDDLAPATVGSRQDTNANLNHFHPAGGWVRDICGETLVWRAVPGTWEDAMNNIDRRHTLALGLIAATAHGVLPHSAMAQTHGGAEGRELLPGVRQIDRSPSRPSKIQGFRMVSMRDVVFQPGAEIPEASMDNAMLCHVTEGALTVKQDGVEFIATTGTAWDCGKGTREAAKNNGTTVAVMRVIDLDMPMT